MPQGKLVTFLRQQFQAGAFGNPGEIERIQSNLEGSLGNLGIQGPLPGLGVRSDPFSLPLSSVPRNPNRKDLLGRDELVDDRARAFGMDELLDRFGAPVESGPGFQVFRQPEQGAPGYGSFVLPRSAFQSPSTTVDQAAGMLNAALSNVQVDASSGKSLTGVAYTREFLQGQAQHLIGMRDQGKDYLAGKNVFYFDTETTGVHSQSRVWQIAGDTYRDSDRVAGGNVDIRFRGMMDGLWASEDGPVSFEEFYERMNKGQKIEWTDDLTGGLKQFLRTANEADYIVAQNAQFDIRQMFKMIGDVYDGADEELVELSQRFVDKVTDPSAVIDTRALAAALAGETPAGADGKRLSIENLLTRTTARQDIAKRYGVDLAELLDPANGGLHNAATDTKVLRYVQELLAEAAGGGDVLRPLTDVDEGFARIVGHGAAQTPLTTMEGYGRSPIVYGIEQTRRLGEFSVQEATVSRLFEGVGRFGRWTDSMMDGSDLAQGKLMFNSGFEQVQAAAIDQNLPFAGISSPERLLSTAVGRSVPFTDSMDDVAGALRNTIGEMTGAGLFRTGTDAVVYGGQNLAVPMRALRDERVADLLSLDRNVLENGATTADDMIAGRLSFYSYADPAGGGIRSDAALVIDPFESLADADVSKRASKLVDILQTEYGLSRDQAEVIRRNPSILRDRGIQIGNLGTGPESDAAFNIAERLGLTVDAKSPHVARVAVGNVVSSGDESYLTTSPAMVGDRSAGRFAGATSEEVFTNMEGLRGIANAVDEHKGDRRLRNLLHYAAKTGNTDRAKRIYDGIGWLKTGGRIPKIAAGIIAVGITGKAISGHREMSQYDETLDFQGYESGGFYEDYREEMGLPRPAPGYQGRHLDTLATAHTVGDLDRNKIQHTTMGSSKYDHLFA